MIKPSISGVLIEQKRMMDLVLSPKSNSVFVILLKLLEN